MGALEIAEVAARELMLFAAVGLLIGGIDDLALDLLYFVGRAWRRRAATVAPRDLRAVPAGRIAIFVPTWREAGVIGPMLRTTLARLDGDYTIYVAAYANDAATRAAIGNVAQGDRRVQLVVNPQAGPTTKADNLNALWRAMTTSDREAGERTRFVVLHDAEDLVHADELRLFDATIGRFDVVQLPVRPLARRGMQFIAGTYGDGFAEAHAKAMVVRAALGAGMPLAGVGCAIRTDALAAVARARGGAPFDPTSLVEDYEAGLRLSELRFRSTFVRHHGDDGLVAVGEYFPDTFGAAIRQKARWMAGIALAGWDRTGWSRPGHLIDHWMRMRDRRALLAIVVLAAAYLSAVMYAGVIVAQWATGRAPAVRISPPGWLLTVNLALLGWRAAMRLAFTWRSYGWRIAAGVPARFFVGNAIDLAASTLALRHYARSLRGAAPVWDKTEHCFPDLAETGAR